MNLDLRGEVAAARQALRDAYLGRPGPRALLRQHARLVDRTVKALWGEAGVSGDAVRRATGFDLPGTGATVEPPPGAAERAALERLDPQGVRYRLL